MGGASGAAGEGDARSQADGVSPAGQPCDLEGRHQPEETSPSNASIKTTNLYWTLIY